MVVVATSARYCTVSYVVSIVWLEHININKKWYVSAQFSLPFKSLWLVLYTYLYILKSLMLSMADLFDLKYSNIVKYYYNLK